MATNINELREPAKPVFAELTSRGFLGVDLVSLGLWQLRDLDANTISDRIKEMNASTVDTTGEFQLRGRQKKFAEAIHLLTVEIFRMMPDEQRASILQNLPAEMRDALATLAALKDTEMPQVAQGKRSGRRKATGAKSA